jgi:hypothetical protein
MQQDRVAESIIDRLADLENHPEEHLAPYEEFTPGAKISNFTPGGFLYHKNLGADEVKGFFCGYLTDEVWKARTADGWRKLCRYTRSAGLGPSDAPRPNIPTILL